VELGEDEDRLYMRQIDYIRETPLKQDLNGVLNLINWAGMSRVYFGKSTAWLYHRLDGVDGNGNPCSFTKVEMEQLRESFKDLARKLDDLADQMAVDKGV